MSTKDLLVVNVYFAPRRFGGATVVAEQMAMWLQKQGQWRVTVFTSLQTPTLPDYAIRRYHWEGINVIAINLPQNLRHDDFYRHPEVAQRFAEVVDTIRPGVAHVHCVQQLGAELLKTLYSRKIPVAVTAHDCWWLCERQFMIDRSGAYCFQKEISPDRCRYCVHDYQQAMARNAYLREVLEGASMLLFPSQFQMDLYVANGFRKERCIVNKNGVKLPKPGFRKAPRKAAPVFGFVGGPGGAKGAELIARAARKLNRDDFSLIVVDAAQNVGDSWKESDDWKLPGSVEVVPAYTQDTIDGFFERIDVLLFPSQCKESFGLTVREALIRDIWVIATDAGGAAEDLRPGRNAEVIPMDGNHEALMRAIISCLDRGDWLNYENECKGNIVTIEHQATQLSDLLDSLF